MIVIVIVTTATAITPRETKAANRDKSAEDSAKGKNNIKN